MHALFDRGCSIKQDASNFRLHLQYADMDIKDNSKIFTSALYIYAIYINSIFFLSTCSSNVKNQTVLQ